MWGLADDLLDPPATDAAGADPGPAGGVSPADAEALHDIRLAVSEVCTNVVEHGYTGEHRGSIAIETIATAECLVVRIEDDAPFFDSSILSPPDTESDWERRDPDNLGWHLVHSVMDEVR